MPEPRREFAVKRIAAYFALSLLALGTLAPGAHAGKLTAGMKEGKPAFQSMGPITFGPEGVLFVADTESAAIVAIATEDVKPAKGTPSLKVEGINQKVAALLGTTADQILI